MNQKYGDLIIGDFYIQLLFVILIILLLLQKKYYEFIHNLPLFIPTESISKNFSKLLDKYPVTPYLDNKMSFIKWTHFIHNKINKKLDKTPINFDKFFLNLINTVKKMKKIIIKQS